jgi:hypothetical protein
VCVCVCVCVCVRFSCLHPPEFWDYRYDYHAWPFSLFLVHFIPHSAGRNQLIPQSWPNLSISLDEFPELKMLLNP